MKIFYAIQGTGNGHISRAEQLYPYLKKFGEVDFFLSGSNAQLETPLPITYKSKGISLHYKSTGGMDYGKISKSLSFNIYKEAKSRYNPDIVIIDYLGIMEADREDLDKEDWLKLEKISEKVHEFARVNTVGVITAMQLNRSKAKEVEEKIGLHRLARSNGVARNANVVIQIESRPQEQSYPDSYYWIIKNRNGMQGKGKMLKSYSCAKLIDCPIELDAENNIKDIDECKNICNTVKNCNSFSFSIILKGNS